MTNLDPPAVSTPQDIPTTRAAAACQGSGM
jgi:hypothetical protein